MKSQGDAGHWATVVSVTWVPCSVCVLVLPRWLVRAAHPAYSQNIFAFSQLNFSCLPNWYIVRIYAHTVTSRSYFRHVLPSVDPTEKCMLSDQLAHGTRINVKLSLKHFNFLSFYFLLLEFDFLFKGSCSALQGSCDGTSCTLLVLSAYQKQVVSPWSPPVVVVVLW